MTLAAALGANLWIVAVLVPLAIDPAWTSMMPLRGVLSVLLLAFSAPALLAWGINRRSDGILLVAFPSVALLPQALLSTGEIGSRLMPAPPIILSAVSLVAYLVAVAHRLRTVEVAGEPLPVTERSLQREKTPSRWLRRGRVYRGLAIVAAVHPLALVAFVNLRPSTVAQLQTSFGARAESAQALLTVGVGLLWMVLFRGYLLAPLHGHLQQDAEIRAFAQAARKQARRGRPRAAFYLAVVVALGAMMAVIWQRSG